MTKDQMESALREAWEKDMGPAKSAWYATAGEHRSFIAGMRAAADIADRKWIGFDNADPDGPVAITAIRAAADELEKSCH